MCGGGLLSGRFAVGRSCHTYLPHIFGKNIAKQQDIEYNTVITSDIYEYKVRTPIGQYSESPTVWPFILSGGRWGASVPLSGESDAPSFLAKGNTISGGLYN